MKACLLLGLSLLVGATAHAQGPRAGARGAREGGMARGEWAHPAHARGFSVPFRSGYYYQHGPGYRHARHGYGYLGYPGYVFYPGLTYAVGGAYAYGDAGEAEPSSAGSGVFWGALAGAVIGHNSGSLHHNSWQGAALGATAGYLLGSIADRSASRRATAAAEARAGASTAASGITVAEAPRAPLAPTAPAAAMAPASPMAPANRLFGR